MTQITFANGDSENLDDIEKEIKLLSETGGHINLVEHLRLVQGLTAHIRRLEKRPAPWTVFWTDGTTHIVYGTTLKEAMDTAPYKKGPNRKYVSMVVVGAVEKDYDYNPMSRSWSAKLM